MNDKSGTRVTTVYAFLAIGDSGNEGLTIFQSGNMWVPLISADQDRLDAMRALAQEMAIGENKQLVLARFTVREDLETFSPLTA